MGVNASTYNEAVNPNLLSWFIRLRWGATAGQLLTVGFCYWGLALELNIPALTWPICLSALSNIVLNIPVAQISKRSVGESQPSIAKAVSTIAIYRVVAAVLLLDTILLTWMLYFSGGASNPFNFLYLVHITLAAVLLPSRWVWALIGVSIGCFAFLFRVPHNSGIFAGHQGMNLHLQGMAVAFAVAAGFIGYFVRRLNEALVKQRQHRAESEAKAQRLASLATLSAGAAHELATPLGTIALAAENLEDDLSSQQSPSAEDIQLIKQEIERCRQIISGLGAKAGQPQGEEVRWCSLKDVLSRVASRYPGLGWKIGPWQNIDVLVPPLALERALDNVVDNGFDAGGPVSIDIGHQKDGLQMRVRDRGTGLSPAAETSAGEPFFTTKPQGHGLGLFLTQLTMQQLGGRFQLVSEKPGTLAILQLPKNRVRQRS